MRNKNIVCDMAERRGAAIARSTGTVPAKFRAAPMLTKGYHRPVDAARTPLRPSKTAEVNLYVDGVSIVVRFPDAFSTREASDPVAANVDIEAMLLNTFGTIVDRIRLRESAPPPGKRLRPTRCCGSDHWNSTCLSERPDVVIVRYCYALGSSGYCDT